MEALQAPCVLHLQLPLDQREGIPHHLIDIMDPSEEFSAGDFHKLGRQAAEDIISVSARIPIACNQVLHPGAPESSSEKALSKPGRACRLSKLTPSKSLFALWGDRLFYPNAAAA